MTEPLRVAITGADGMIAGLLRARLSDRFAPRWLARSDADVTDVAALERAFVGIEAVVHLAANADPYASWEEVLSANVVGTYFAFEAARRAGVRRVVLASSNHAMGMYMWDDDVFADPTHPTRLARMHRSGRTRFTVPARRGARRWDASTQSGTAWKSSASGSVGCRARTARRRAPT